jgi:hypothetical protein
LILFSKKMETFKRKTINDALLKVLVSNNGFIKRQADH